VKPNTWIYTDENGRKSRVEIGCTCEGDNYPCEYCLKLEDKQARRWNDERNTRRDNDAGQDGTDPPREVAVG